MVYARHKKKNILEIRFFYYAFERGSLTYMNLLRYLPETSFAQYSILTTSGILHPVKYVKAQFPFILAANIINKNPSRYKGYKQQRKN